MFTNVYQYVYHILKPYYCDCDSNTIPLFGVAVRSCWGIWPVPLFLDADWGAGVGATLIHENKILNDCIFRKVHQK